MEDLLQQRILILDGAMGTEIQRFKLTEEDFRGTRFSDWNRDLQGDNDLLVLTKPDLIGEIHTSFLEAGADIIETNTFNGTRISQADYGMEAITAEINETAAKVARDAADRFMAKNPGRPVYVAGGLGPTNRTASISPDVNDPGFRAINFDQLVEAYAEQAEALLKGGVDTLLVETIFDTLNAKAAIYAIEEVFDKRGERVPIQISVTITDKSGRTLSGQTVEAFWNSIAHAKPLSVGINCALGAEDMRPFLRDLAAVATCYTSCYPNAGLPNAFGEYDDTPENMARVLGDFAEEGLINIVGGCCGTRPDHIRAISERMKEASPRNLKSETPALRLSGLEPLTL